jgi:hypothetical protein
VHPERIAAATSGTRNGFRKRTRLPLSLFEKRDHHLGLCEGPHGTLLGVSSRIAGRRVLCLYRYISV